MELALTDDMTVLIVTGTLLLAVAVSTTGRHVSKCVEQSPVEWQTLASMVPLGIPAVALDQRTAYSEVMSSALPSLRVASSWFLLNVTFSLQSVMVVGKSKAGVNVVWQIEVVTVL